jgi:hypothetical protein
MGTRGLIAVVAAALFASCDSRGPTPPSGPPARTDSHEVALLSTTPPSGSTILTAQCIADSFPGTSRPVCSSDPTLSFVIRSDRAIANASLDVELYTASELRCAVLFTPRVQVAAGVPTPIRSEVAFLSAHPHQAPLCPMPVTTTRIVAHLRDGNDTRLLTAEFAATFTFAHPPNGPRLFPPS